MLYTANMVCIDFAGGEILLIEEFLTERVKSEHTAAWQPSCAWCCDVQEWRR